ncbi:Galectin-3-binding protein B [Holothuria leucospilota]|uniref:Galectin-3-binding protein B n=1 Tax=Holothuria leucospilota TaxID=206669 RepID=A0A9Q1BX37_HOLLE|nr:Galectin-3-binding protein B [Holothuria leucospilota]
MTVEDVRLADGFSNSSGRVEVLFNRDWGTVCNQGWDLVDANVVCRQLGYPAAIVTYRNSLFGEGSGLIWLTNVNCNGNELSLSECQHTKFAQPSCSHHQDVGVLCGGKNLLALSSIRASFLKVF